MPLIRFARSYGDKICSIKLVFLIRDILSNQDEKWNKLRVTDLTPSLQSFTRQNIFIGFDRFLDLRYNSRAS